MDPRLPSNVKRRRLLKHADYEKIQKSMTLSENFIPCDSSLEAKFNYWLQLKHEQGLSYNARLMQSKAMLQPSLTARLVTALGLDSAPGLTEDTRPIVIQTREIMMSADANRAKQMHVNVVQTASQTENARASHQPVQFVKGSGSNQSTAANAALLAAQKAAQAISQRYLNNDPAKQTTASSSNNKTVLGGGHLRRGGPMRRLG